MRKVRWDPEKSELRLLIIEDDPSRVEVFESWLKYMDTPFNLKMVQASSAHEAVEAIDNGQKHRISGVLLDADIDLQNATSWTGRLSGKDVVEKISEVVTRDVPIRLNTESNERGLVVKTQLETAGFTVLYIPFGTGSFGDYKEWVTGVCEAHTRHGRNYT